MEVTCLLTIKNDKGTLIFELSVAYDKRRKLFAFWFAFGIQH